MPKSNLRIDPDGVLRGYYVYVHKDQATGKVFYVGKGQGKRAWSKSKRPSKWQDIVASLGETWNVEIVKHDLSELEAYALEAELVNLHGGAAAEGGGLTNWFPGGENPASISIAIHLGTGLAASLDVYDQERKFKTLPRAEQESVAILLKQYLENATDAMQELAERAEDREDDVLADSVSELDSILGSQLDVVNDFLRRRIAWQEFALGFEEMLDDLPREAIGSLHRRAQTVAHTTVRESTKLFKLIDSGNRSEAEEKSSAALRKAAADAGLAPDID